MLTLAVRYLGCTTEQEDSLGVNSPAGWESERQGTAAPSNKHFIYCSVTERSQDETSLSREVDHDLH